jgi:hypothetical protein
MGPVSASGLARDFMKIKIDRIISIATLTASLVAIFLVLKKPAPVAHPQNPAAIAANAQSFDEKLEKLELASVQHGTGLKAPPAQSAPQSTGQSVSLSPNGSYAAPSPISDSPESVATTSVLAAPGKAEVHVNSDEVGAALAQALGAVGSGELSPDTNLGSGQPAIKDQQISFDGDLVHGQFLTEIAGKDVWVTVSGHLASKDGYATFDPTEFKIGDLSVPVSLVNPSLQKKLAEQRDRLKLPDYVGDVKVQNGELVIGQK